MTQKEKILLFLLAAINFTHILDFMIMMPLNPQLSVIFNINQQQFSLLVSAYTFSAFFSGIIAAFFVDGFDRKKYCFSVMPDLSSAPSVVLYLRLTIFYSSQELLPACSAD